MCGEVKVCAPRYTDITGKRISKRLCAECTVKNSHLMYNESNQDEWIECRLCGFRAKDLGQHLKSAHNTSAAEYGITKSKICCDRVTGDKNPAYQHGGKFSPWSDKSIKHTEEVRKAAIEKAEANRVSTAQLEYYTRQGMTEEESIEARSKRQTTFSLEKCIEKHGPIEGVMVWQERQLKWAKSFKKQNFSKVSQELFNEIMTRYDGDVYFATFDRIEVEDRQNKEYILTLDKSYCRPDFICLDSKKVIEFDGDYWHSEAQANPSREAERDAAIINQGYEILHVKECDFRKNRQETVDKCINFLSQ